MSSEGQNITSNVRRPNNYKDTTMIKAYFTSILIIFIDLTLLGQVRNSQLIEEKVKYQYDNTKPNETYVPKNQLGKEVQINFDCCFNDSVQVFVNGKKIESLFLNTDKSTSFTGHSITVKFDKKKKNTTLKVVLPSKQVFCNIILNKKYKLLNVNRMECSDKKWWLTFRNFGVFYE